MLMSKLKQCLIFVFVFFVLTKYRRKERTPQEGKKYLLVITKNKSDVHSLSLWLVVQQRSKADKRKSHRHHSLSFHLRLLTIPNNEILDYDLT